ncbi:MAG: hypothetical protein Q4B54_14465, partial [Coriobacteriales bacterium]|nr:hypothetical protein [Coriobacteriales bacterium]
TTAWMASGMGFSGYSNGGLTGAYYIFLGVVFRRLSERRSTARRCALARNIGADGPHDRVRTCDAAILAHI